MSDSTTNLILPFVLAAQAQKHVTMNDALQILDGVINLAVVDRDLATPPGSPADGARYLVAASPTGLWAGWAGDIAMWVDGNWRRLVAREGWIVWVADENIALVRRSGAWQPFIERGSNGNGAWVRLADGTQICTQSQVVNATINTAGGGAFNNGSNLTWTYPQAFLGGSTVFPNIEPLHPGGGHDLGALAVTAGVSALTYRLLRAASDATARDHTVLLQAVGRWF